MVILSDAPVFAAIEITNVRFLWILFSIKGSKHVNMTPLTCIEKESKDAVSSISAAKGRVAQSNHHQ
jgi:hypothetical protein